LSFADDVNGLANTKAGIENFDRFMMQFFDWTESFVPAPTKYADGSFYRRKGEQRTRITAAEVSFNGQRRSGMIEQPYFKLLGKRYQCDGDLEGIRSWYLQKLHEQLKRIDEAKVNCSIKLRMYKLGFGPFNRWIFQVQDFSRSYVTKFIRSLVIRYLCKWSGLAACSNRAVLFLPSSNLGLNLPCLVTEWEVAQLTKANTLNFSKDGIVQALWLDEKNRAHRDQ
jgi:hypothetical protein